MGLLLRARIGTMTLISLVVLTVTVAAVMILHLHIQPVLSGSMRPGLEPGDLAITQRVAASDMSAGDVIAFYPPGSHELVLHRIVTMQIVDGETIVTTQGDANNTVDPWGKLTVKDPAYRLLTDIPKAGFLVVWGRHLVGPALILAGLLIGLSLFPARTHRADTRPEGATEGRWSS
jgi:signal peptidase I